MSEVKNVRYLAFTQQLRDYVGLAQQLGGRLTIFVRTHTKLSAELEAAAVAGTLKIVRF